MPPPRVIIIGAGSRGQVYAKSILACTDAVIAAVAEPVPYKRRSFGKAFVWPSADSPSEGQEFAHWADFVEYETARRKRAAAGENVPPGVDVAFVCVLDEEHRDVIVGLAPLSLHVMCEKPLATRLDDCLDMYRALVPSRGEKVFSIGHVLRYSPHNMLLRKILVDDRAIGDVCSVEHTEPVGWWHFAHSYVRGNWRNSDISSPSLLAKSCHDVDFLLWLLSSPARAGRGEPHLPSTVSSTGTLQVFKKSRKPKAAGSATNCMRCPLGDAGCKYSAKNIYTGPHCEAVLRGENKTMWPVNVVLPEIEDMPTVEERRSALLTKLEEDYDASTASAEEVAKRGWYGRCVYESDNNVCDDQTVTITWDDEERPSSPPHTPATDEAGQVPAAEPDVTNNNTPRYAKSATLHMVAHTRKVCQRYTHIYGTDGEIHADSHTITVTDFNTGETRSYTPTMEDAGHGGGDLGLTRQFMGAVDAVMNQGWDAERAQAEFVGCTLEEVVRSHVMVFAAEEARKGKKVLDWGEWWEAEIAGKLSA